MATWEELKAQAEKLGFTFQPLAWEVEDDDVGDDYKDEALKKSYTGWRVSFPPDFFHAKENIVDNGDGRHRFHLENLIKEYGRREEIEREEEILQAGFRDAMAKLSKERR